MTRKGLSAAVLTGVILSTALFAGVQALLTSLADPVGFYAPDAVPVLPAGGSPAPGRGVLDAETVKDILTSPLVEMAVAEMFLYTTLHGDAVVARGAHLPALLALHGGTTDASLADDPNATTLLVGEHLARRQGLRVGDTIFLPASIGSDVAWLRVDGIVRAPTGLADELLVDEATGRRLAGLSAGSAHFVEVRPVDAGAFDAWIARTRELPRLVAEAPATARSGTLMDIRVNDTQGNPIPGARVSSSFTGAVRTDAQGVARVLVPGSETVWRVNAPGFAEARVRTAGLPPDAGIVATRLQSEPSNPLPAHEWTLRVHLENLDDKARNGTVHVRLDGAEVLEMPVDLAARERRVVDVPMEGLSPGEHAVAADSARLTVVAMTPAELAAQFRLEGSGRALQSYSMRDALDDVFGSVLLAAILLGGLAFLLFFMGNAALFARLVREREGELRLLRALGARRAQVRRFVARRLGVAAAAGAVVGLLLGALAAEAYVRSGFWTLFGYGLQLEWSIGRVLSLLLLALACTGGAVLAATEILLRRPLSSDANTAAVARPAELDEVLNP